MKIDDNKRISMIQAEFNEKFPFLKIEFYKKAHESTEGSSNADLLSDENTIGDIRTVHNSGDLSINEQLKVNTLENSFRDHYGLNVQVFRRSGDLWLQTTSTDHWTLAEQNEHGR